MLHNKTLLIKIFLFLTVIESGLTLYTLASIPADAKNSVFLGFSMPRLILMLGVVLVLCIAMILLVRFFLSPVFFQKTIRFIESCLGIERISIAIDVAAWLIFALAVLFLLLPESTLGAALYQRGLPVVVLSVLIALQTLLFQFLWKGRRVNLDSLLQWKSVWGGGGITLGIFIVLWIFIAVTGIGILPEKTGWYPPGTPVLPQQVLAAWAIGFLFFLGGILPWFKKNSEKLDYVIALVVWLTAGLIWLMEPLRELSYFTTAPTPPNFESYPYSDSALYDMFAQNYLIGVSRDVGLTHRPLYSIFLAFLHTLFGQDYASIISAQVVILAVFPAALYLLVSKLGGRPAAILIALIAIFREQNAIALTNVIEVSHSKLLLSDVPTMASIILFMYFLVKWVQDQDNRMYLGAVAGMFLGLAIFIRSQSQLLVPVIMTYLLIALGGGWKSNIKKALIFLFGVMVIVTPWVWRNYQVSGRAVVEYHDFYTRVIASGYTESQDAIEQLPGETVDEYNSRMLSMIVNYIRENPAEVSRFYASYFLHNEISSIVYLPMTLKFYDERTYVRELGMWNPRDPLGSPPVEVMPLFLFALGMIALGVGVAYKRAKWIGLAPLLPHLFYSLSIVPFKTSGWRFILPADWVSALYFSIGLMHLSIMVFSLFSKKYEQIIDHTVLQNAVGPISWKGTLPILSVFFFIGLSFPLIERMIPQRYLPLDFESLLQQNGSDEILLENGEAVSARDVESFLEGDTAAVVLHGRALYPSFYESGEFWGDGSVSPDITGISRLQFFLIGSVRDIVFIPLSDTPSMFPNGSDVLIIGCQEERGIRALAVRVDDQPIFIPASPWEGLTCPVQ